MNPPVAKPTPRVMQVLTRPTRAQFIHDSGPPIPPHASPGEKPITSGESVYLTARPVLPTAVASGTDNPAGHPDEPARTLFGERT
jgi:hypothetical protein